MASDLVERLRAARYFSVRDDVRKILDEAADTLKANAFRIVVLEAELAEARKAVEANDAEWRESLQSEYARAEFHRARAAAAQAERDELDALYHEGGTWEQQLSTAEARATAAEARAEKMAEALAKLLACPAIADENHSDPEWGDAETAEAVALARAALGRPE